MHDPTRAYDQTVELLRSLSARHARALEAMTGGAATPGALPASYEQVERMALDARILEDEGIAALGRLCRLTSRATAGRAAEEAGAGWLLEVVLNRAVETTGAGARAA